jgi:hypothetical protein
MVIIWISCLRQLWKNVFKRWNWKFKLCNRWEDNVVYLYLYYIPFMPWCEVEICKKWGEDEVLGAVKDTIQRERNKFVLLHLKTQLLIAVFRLLKVLAWKEGWNQCTVQVWKCTEFCVIASHQIMMWCNLLEEGKFTSWCWVLFIGVFVKLQKALFSFVMSVRLSAWNNSASTGQIFMKFYIRVFFEKLVWKFKFN